MIEIIELQPDDWQKLRDVRLEQLQSDPLAFGRYFDEEKNKTEEEWRKSLEKSQDSNYSWSLFAQDGDRIVGMIGGRRDNILRHHHVTTIGPMYVAQDYRGKGVAQSLMEAMFNKFRKHPEIIKVCLMVNTVQIPAIKFYEKMGFKNVGTSEKELCIDGKYYDEYYMEKFLD